VSRTLKASRTQKSATGKAGRAADVPPAVLADRTLVDRCRAGDVLAWEQIYRQCHGPLLVAIKVYLGHHAASEELAEEIAARVWCSLIDDRGALLDRFDFRRGCRLTTFLAALAKKDVLRYLRGERRRQLREASTLRKPRTAGSAFRPVEMDLDMALAEFMATLSLRERQFCQQYLLARSDDASLKYTCSNRWQLQHRVKRKLRVFLNAS